MANSLRLIVFLTACGMLGWRFGEQPLTETMAWVLVLLLLIALQHTARVQSALLDSLRLIVTWNRDHAEARMGDPDEAESWACVRRARAAIAYATGRAAERGKDAT